MAVLLVAFSKKETPPGINGLFTYVLLEEFIEVKNYRAVNCIFPFLSDFSDRCLGRMYMHEKTTSQYRNIYLINLFTCDVNYLHGSDVCHMTIESLVSTRKRTYGDTYAAHCKKGFFTLSFHPIDHLREDLRSFESETYLESSFFEHL